MGCNWHSVRRRWAACLQHGEVPPAFFPSDKGERSCCRGPSITSSSHQSLSLHYKGKVSTGCTWLWKSNSLVMSRLASTNRIGVARVVPVSSGAGCCSFSQQAVQCPGFFVPCTRSSPTNWRSAGALTLRKQQDGVELPSWLLEHTCLLWLPAGTEGSSSCCPCELWQPGSPARSDQGCSPLCTGCSNLVTCSMLDPAIS